MPEPKPRKPKKPDSDMKFFVTATERRIIEAAARYVAEGNPSPESLRMGTALAYICETWLRKVEEERRQNESDVIPF